MFYERQHDIQYQDAQEVMVRTKAGAMGTISEEQFVGVDLSMDNTFYKNNLFEDYTSVELNPYYTIRAKNWKIRLGAHVHCIRIWQEIPGSTGRDSPIYLL